MSAKHQTNNPPPSLTVLQLDTTFPRIPGDVASPETYLKPIAVVPIPKARVVDIVTSTPDQANIAGFETAVQQITTGIGVTSCGFMGYWQDRLNAQCSQPFLSSSLIDLPVWAQHQSSQNMAIVTFDAATLHAPHYADLLNGFDGTIIGLKPDMHLRKVITGDLAELDQSRACDELIDLLRPYLADGVIDALVLECTNLPPYKDAIKKHFDVKVYDILTSIASRDANLVNPRFL